MQGGKRFSRIAWAAILIERDGKKCYFCPFVGDEIPNGLVDPTFDAFKCIRERRYSKKTC